MPLFSSQVFVLLLHLLASLVTVTKRMLAAGFAFRRYSRQRRREAERLSKTEHAISLPAFS
jgi:hypothetical protein